MPYKFSEKLRERIKKYFLKCHNLVISEEEADEYLDSLADLVLIFQSMRKEADAPPQGQADASFS